MKLFFTLSLLCSFALLQAQTTSTFEDLVTEVDTFDNGADGSGGFTDGNIFLPNNNFGSFWTGWSISSKVDVTTAGFTNQYSAITGEGFESSNTYAHTLSRWV